MTGITGSVHTCQSHPVAFVGSKPFSVKQPARFPRICHSSAGNRAALPQRSRLILRAQQGGPEGQEKPAEREAPKLPPGTGGKQLEPGQGTAIVTGAISIVFGVLYLVLVQLMDTRGNQLEPPPPEAFEQGFLHVSSLMK
ncbi:g5149 [Coccomyxa viridis]|uniref:G5149 protein n=1 Tax=Coccomyxa viridis TaxID=1274662 RepID=A0ABP1FX73_9CHLO